MKLRLIVGIMDFQDKSVDQITGQGVKVLRLSCAQKGVSGLNCAIKIFDGVTFSWDFELLLRWRHILMLLWIFWGNYMFVRFRFKKWNKQESMK